MQTLCFLAFGSGFWHDAHVGMGLGMSIEKAASRVRVIARHFPSTLPPMEAGLLIVMLLLAVAGSL